MRPKVNVSLTPELVAFLKSYITDENLTWIDSAYGGRRCAFAIPEDEIREKFPFLLEASSFDRLIDNYMTVIARHNPIPQWFIDKYDVTDWQIALLQRSYFDYEEDENGADVVTLGYKRPFGNSSVEYDVREEMLRAEASKRTMEETIAMLENDEGDDEGDDEDDEDFDPEKYAPFLDQSVDMITRFLIEVPFDERLEAESDGYRFKLTDRYMRVAKIESFGI